MCSHRKTLSQELWLHLTGTQQINSPQSQISTAECSSPTRKYLNSLTPFQNKLLKKTKAKQTTKNIQWEEWVRVYCILKPDNLLEPANSQVHYPWKTTAEHQWWIHGWYSQSSRLNPWPTEKMKRHPMGALHWTRGVFFILYKLLYISVSMNVLQQKELEYSSLIFLSTSDL